MPVIPQTSIPPNIRDLVFLGIINVVWKIQQDITIEQNDITKLRTNTIRYISRYNISMLDKLVRHSVAVILNRPINSETTVQTANKILHVIITSAPPAELSAIIQWV